MHEIEGSIHTPGFNKTFEAKQYDVWNGTRIEYVLDFKNQRKVIHPLSSILVIEFTAMGSNKIEYSVSNGPLKTLNIAGITKKEKRSLEYPRGWSADGENAYSACNAKEDSVCGTIRLRLNKILCSDNRVQECGDGAFSTENTNRKITFVYTFDKKQEEGKKEVMPGLMLTWWTQQNGKKKQNGLAVADWPDRFLELSEPGRTVKSPDYRNRIEGKTWKSLTTDWGQNRQQNPESRFDHPNYRSYSVVLHLTSEVVEKVKKAGKLVVQIETDTQEGEVFVEEGIRGLGVFKSSNILWQESDEQCAGYGGQLASVTREDEIIAAENCWIGLTGVKGKGWRWTDGSSWNSTWNFTNWENGARYKDGQIKSDQCVKTLNDGTWRKTGCANSTEQCFVCGFKRGRRTLDGEQNLTLEYRPSELPLPLINITFVYNATTCPKRLCNKVKFEIGSKFPGFRVTWKAFETSKVTELEEGEWKQHLFHPNQRQASFLLTTSLVREVLKAGTTWETLRDNFFAKREEYIKDLIGCSEGYLPEPVYLGLLEHLKNYTNTSMSIKEVYPSKGEMQRSLRVYFLLSQCSEENQKALQFINKHKGSPGTLLQAIVNTLSKNLFQEKSTRVHFNEFYSVLERELELEHGKLLLALGSPAQLEAILEKELPYLDNYKTEVTACLHEVNVTPNLWLYQRPHFRETAPEPIPLFRHFHHLWQQLF